MIRKILSDGREQFSDEGDEDEIKTTYGLEVNDFF